MSASTTLKIPGVLSAPELNRLRDGYRRNVAHFLVWLVQAREAGALEARAKLRFLRTVD